MSHAGTLTVFDAVSACDVIVVAMMFLLSVADDDGGRTPRSDQS